MKNLMIVLVTVASGLAYGWLIVKYPIVAQIIAGGAVLSFLFIATIALLTTKGDKPPKL
jgi:hypothetical protein